MKISQKFFFYFSRHQREKIVLSPFGLSYWSLLPIYFLVSMPTYDCSIFLSSFNQQRLHPWVVGYFGLNYININYSLFFGWLTLYLGGGACWRPEWLMTGAHILFKFMLPDFCPAVYLGGRRPLTDGLY